MNRSSSEHSDERIREVIRERMERHPDLDTSGIEVQVTNGGVTLEGEVSERQAIRMAKDVAEGVPGVRELTNLLRVQERSEDEARDENDQGNTPRS